MAVKAGPMERLNTTCIGVGMYGCLPDAGHSWQATYICGWLCGDYSSRLGAALLEMIDSTAKHIHSYVVHVLTTCTRNTSLLLAYF